MKQYVLDKTDLAVSRIAFGCMRLAGREEDGLKAIQIALDCGINFFDHADIYGRGKSEEVFSRILKEQPHLRDSIIVQSKCGICPGDTPEAGYPPRFDFSYEHITASVDHILNRLQTDHLDLLLLHRPDPLVEPEEVARAFDHLHFTGKVRYFGVSNHNAAQIELLQACLPMPLVANQMELSVSHARLIEEGVVVNQNTPSDVVRGNGTLEYCRLHKIRGNGTLEYCRLHHIMIQAWSPLAGGRLTGMDQPMGEIEDRLLEVLHTLAEEYGISVEAMMIAWLLRHPAGIQPIIGTMSPERVAAICKADDVQLSREDWYRIYNAGRPYRLP